MNNRNLINGGPLLICLLLIIGGCSKSDESTTNIEERTISVKGMEVAPVTRNLSKTFTGSLEGEQQAIIRAKISEAVDKIEVTEGSVVKSNDVIVRLDKTGPTSNYLQAGSVFQNAEKNFRKMEFLFKEGAISETQFDGSKTEYEVAKANYEAASQLVDLRTPIAGTVTSIDVSIGDYVSPGQQVATVATVDNLRMKLGINAAEIGYFKNNDAVRILVESVPGFTADGRVAMIARSADPVTRTFQVEIDIKNVNHIFKPGMFARAEVVIENFDNILVVPRIAVLTRNDKNYLFVVSGDRALIHEVVTGMDFNGTIEIKSGLKAGDTLVTVGQDYLENNVRVKLARFVNVAGEEIEL